MRHAIVALAVAVACPAAAQSSLTGEQRSLITAAAGMALIHVHCNATLSVDTEMIAKTLSFGGVDLKQPAPSKFYDAEVLRFAANITANNRAAFCAIAESRYAGNGFVSRRR